MNTSLTVGKQRFLNELLNSEDSKSCKYTVMNREEYEILLQEIKDAKLASKKTSLQYRRLNRFDIIEVGGVQRIIAKSKNEEILYYLPVEEIFDEIEKAHIAIGHGGRDRLRTETGRSSGKRYPCDICGKIYKQPGTRNRHKKGHFNFSHECWLCCSRFSRKDTLKYHMVSAHHTKWSSEADNK